EGGFLRMKCRRDRRSSVPRESPLRFYPKFLWELSWKQIRWAHLYLRLYRFYSKLRTDPRRTDYIDLAITPITDDEIETREMFQTAEAQAYVVRIQRPATVKSDAPVVKLQS